MDSISPSDRNSAWPDRQALVAAAAAGALLQLGMVVGGHFSVTVADQFAWLGSGIAALSGLLYGWRQRRASGWRAGRGGALVGGSSALLALLVSYLLGDVPDGIVRLGTAGATLAGGLGGLLGELVRRGQ